MTAYEQIEALVDAFDTAAFEYGEVPLEDHVACERLRIEYAERRTALLAAVKALTEDAERYRFMKDWDDSDRLHMIANGTDHWDATIDAARSAASAADEGLAE